MKDLDQTELPDPLGAKTDVNFGVYELHLDEISPAHIRSIGHRLYGYSETGKRSWKTQVATLLGLTPESINNYLKGQYEIPASRRRQIRELICVFWPSAFKKPAAERGAYKDKDKAA